MLVVIAAAGGAYMYKKNRVATPLDEIKTALQRPGLPVGPHSTIGCRTYNTGPETVLQVANAMVPVSVIPNVSTTDTTLFVFPADPAGDSLITAVTSGRKRLWEKRSPAYYFILTSSTFK